MVFLMENNPVVVFRQSPAKNIMTTIYIYYIEKAYNVQ